MTGSLSLDVDGVRVAVSHPDKVVFPGHDGHAERTKLELIRYYLSVADGALRGVAGRPMILKRFVKGLEEEAIFQKRAPQKRPDFVDVAELRYASGTSAQEATSTRIRYLPKTSTILTNSASIWTRCPECSGVRFWTLRWSPAQCSKITG
jgi:DNA primase